MAQNGPFKRWIKKEQLLEKINEIFEASFGSYGSPRIAEELRKFGFVVLRQRTARIMKAAWSMVKRERKFKSTTDSVHNYPIVPNILNREFMVTRPGQVWVSNITYIKTSKGWLYLTVIIDLFDCKVVGWCWSMNKGLSTEETTITAWRMAMKAGLLWINSFFTPTGASNMPVPYSQI